MLYAFSVAASLAAVLLTGLMAGLFFVFSIAVMPALNAAPPRTAIAAMQAINRRIRNPLFFLAFFGAPAASLSAGLLFLSMGAPLPGAAMLASGALYLLGVLAPTVGVHVKLNDRLDRAAVPAEDAGAAGLWSGYARAWIPANHVRSCLAAVSLMMASLALFWRGWDAAMIAG